MNLRTLHFISCILFLTLVFPLQMSASGNDSTNIWRKPKLFLQFDRYNSFVSNQGANMSGLKAGVGFGNKYRFGIGIYNLKSDIIEYKKLNAEQAIEAPADTVKALLNRGYIPLCFEYIFYEKGNWQFSLPIHLGFGETYFTYYNNNGDTKKLKGQPVILTDVVVAGQYKILKWVGVGAGFGFRKMLVNNPAIQRDFNSPLYNLRLKIFLGEVYRTVFPKGLSKKKDKE